MKLNLGCGNKLKTGYVGVDRYPCDAAEVIADLDGILPFQNESISEVLMDNVIEHVRSIPALMQEIQRVCVDGAVVNIITPHFASLASWRDPTHIHHLSYFSMEHFEKENVSHYTGGGFRVLSRRLSFGGVMGLCGRLIYYLSPRAYESQWCFIFRPSTLRFKLEVKKG